MWGSDSASGQLPEENKSGGAVSISKLFLLTCFISLRECPRNALYALVGGLPYKLPSDPLYALVGLFCACRGWFTDLISCTLPESSKLLVLSLRTILDPDEQQDTKIIKSALI